VFAVHLDISFQFLQPTNALFYFCSIHPTHVSAVTRPSSRHVDKFTSLFTGPFGIITTVTLFEACNSVTVVIIQNGPVNSEVNLSMCRDDGRVTAETCVG
jgi:hypothetical protein